MLELPAFRVPTTAQILAMTLMCVVPERIAHAQAATAGYELKVEGKFKAPESHDKKPRGISGMACLGRDGDEKRQCLTVNDEELSTEIVTLKGDIFHVKSDKDPIVLVNKHHNDVLGEKTTAHCPEGGETEWKELDGEGIALADGYFYISGSHACSRKGEFNPSTFLLTRFKSESPEKISDSGQPTIERTWRLGNVLPPIPSISGWDKKNPAKVAELGREQRNIEGIAVIDGRLYAGLRTPNLDGEVLIVSAPVKDLFTEGNRRLLPEDSEKQQIHLHFDNNVTGIRDLAALPVNGGLLVLTGPTLEQDVPYDLYWVKDLKPHPSLKHLRTLSTERIKVRNKESEDMGEVAEKAETVTVLSETPGTATVLILFDNVDEGKPTRYEITLPQ